MQGHARITSLITNFIALYLKPQAKSKRNYVKLLPTIYRVNDFKILTR